MQQSGFGCGGVRLARSFSSKDTTCFGSQNCRTRLSAIRASVLPLGGRQSVARIGSHTTSTRSFRSLCRASSCCLGRSDFVPSPDALERCAYFCVLEWSSCEGHFVTRSQTTRITLSRLAHLVSHARVKGSRWAARTLTKSRRKH